MSVTSLGLHHVTAISGPAQQNVDFYVGVLGLRLVKKTVNFDDPGTYHLYYGDNLGHPGTIMTFFPWAGAYRGRAGSGMASETAFSIPEASIDYWTERLDGAGLSLMAPVERFGEQVIRFNDPDGLRLELVAHQGAELLNGWKDSSVPAEHVIRSFHSVTLDVARINLTAQVLTDILGFVAAGEEDGRIRFRLPGGGPGSIIDLLPSGARGIQGVGTVHHIAFRARNEEEHLEWLHRIESIGMPVSEVRDRQYFRSIYFREPSGVLFEIATDVPGFAIDEPPEELGTHLKLPPWLEPRRAELEATLDELTLPTSTKTGQHA